MTIYEGNFLVQSTQKAEYNVVESIYVKAVIFIHSSNNSLTFKQNQSVSKNTPHIFPFFVELSKKALSSEP